MAYIVSSAQLVGLVGIAVCLTGEIRSRFPSLREPQAYADVIMAGHRLKARDRHSAKKRAEFLRGGQIKSHTFDQAYSKRGILMPIKDAERRRMVASERGKCFVFGQEASNALTTERSAMLDHAGRDAHVLAVIVKFLKLAKDSKIADVQSVLERGDLFSQVATYEKVYNELGRHGIPREGYAWLGIRTVPVSHYYLSRQSIKMLAKCGVGGEAEE